MVKYRTVENPTSGVTKSMSLETWNIIGLADIWRCKRGTASSHPCLTRPVFKRSCCTGYLVTCTFSKCADTVARRGRVGGPPELKIRSASSPNRPRSTTQAKQVHPSRSSDLGKSLCAQGSQSCRVIIRAHGLSCRGGGEVTLIGTTSRLVCKMNMLQSKNFYPTFCVQTLISWSYTWAFFETKFYYGGNNGYVWHKLNMFSRWIPATETMILVVFDPPAPIREKLPTPMIPPFLQGRSKDPFWVYEGILREILDLQDKSVWMIRDQVRVVEKNRALVTQPNPNYSHLHELARHAIHVSETLDTAATTVNSILQRHAEYVAGVSDANKDQTRSSKQLQDRLHFLEQMFISLKHRSSSNQARLQNEIQLSFNIVAQSDARTSVEIGRAAQKDSAAMKTVAFLTLVFLPATFISAIFSTSFFNFDGPEGTWTISDKIWIYWAVAIPVTLFTILLWYFWHMVIPQALIGDRRLL
ncbi:hypothetical protein KVR01_008184 [Diaporthe batatas]|uniref:uncharacterized protein n=1 Tax=Diaporthe batatas TaxID=748121 RepID=UPI001D0521B9|nr:uncharacterized protein KVR01_008184 [Diaporthe batatas]KAG8162419.1 hypothetical protein KVR01_008184 [Diaporthe batatas]